MDVIIVPGQGVEIGIRPAVFKIDCHRKEVLNASIEGPCSAEAHLLVYLSEHPIAPSSQQLKKVASPLCIKAALAGHSSRNCGLPAMDGGAASLGITAKPRIAKYASAVSVSK